MGHHGTSTHSHVHQATTMPWSGVDGQEGWPQHWECLQVERYGPVGLWDLKSNKLGYGPPTAMVKYFHSWSCTPTLCLVQDTLVRLFRKDAFAIAKDDEIRDVLKCIDVPAEAWTRDERALKKHDKTNTQITQNSHTLLGIACSVPKWSHCDGGNYRCDDPFHESVRNHETAKPSWDTARGRKESKELTVNIISHILTIDILTRSISHTSTT